jgi:multidrug efflux pump subunit AcrB
MWLVRLALGNIYGVAVIAMLIGVLGGVALMSIPVDILPTFKTPAVQVLTYFNGMPTGQVERTLTDRIERWVNQAPGVADVESRSVVGVSVVKLYFQDDIDPNSALTMTNSLALGSLPTLPRNTLPPVVLPFDPTATMPLGILTVSNANLSEAKVKDIARVQTRNALGSVKGCIAPVVVGGKDRRLMIYLDPKKLEDRELSALDVVKAIDEGNLMVTPGTIYLGKRQLAIETNVMVNGPEDLNEMPITVGDQQIVIRNIGHAEDSNVIQKSRVRVNGERQVYVPIYRQTGESSLAVVERLKNRLPEIEQKLPEGSKLEFVMDQTGSVRQAIESLIHEGAIGAILVAVMILVFLGSWRMTLIATLMLPLAILCGIVGLWSTSNTINVMTLAGLFLAIGPLVDNAIVVLENTHRHHAMGKTPHQAALDGCGELTLPVLLATCTTILVLAPIAMMPGLGGFLFKPLAIAVAFTMVASFILAWTFVPSMAAFLMGGEHHRHGGHASHGHHRHGHANHAALAHPDETAHPPSATTHSPDEVKREPGFFDRIYAKIDGFLKAATRQYEAILNVALANRALVLVLVAALFLASLSLLRGIGQEFFPQVDAGQITVQIRCPSDLRLDAAEERIVEVEQFIRENIPEDERAMIVSEMGLNPDWSSAYTRNAGQQDAVIRIQLTDKRRLSSQEYAIKLRHAFQADKRFVDLASQTSFDTSGIVSTALNYGQSSPIDIQIDASPVEAMDLAQEIRSRVSQVPGAVDVRIAQRIDSPYIMIKVDRHKAASVGLTTRDVIMQVVTAMNSSIAVTRNFWIDPKTGNNYFIAVQYPEDKNFRIEDLKNVMATGTKQKKPVPLSTLIELEQGVSEVELNHAGLRRVTNVLVNIEGRDIAGVASDIQRTLKDVDTKGMRVELKGEYARMKESFSKLGGGLILASILVYLLMVPLFRSFVSPLIIMFTVPLGLIGVLATLYLTNTTLNVQSEMGVIFLVGIVVSNGVLLLDFANKLRKEGATVHEAIVKAATIRFKPIMMTFLATFLDLLPLAIGMGKGSEAITPLARAVCGGLLTSTFLTLIVVPILYTLLIHDRRKRHHRHHHHHEEQRPENGDNNQMNPQPNP